MSDPVILQDEDKAHGGSHVVLEAPGKPADEAGGKGRWRFVMKLKKIPREGPLGGSGGACWGGSRSHSL